MKKVVFLMFAVFIANIASYAQTCLSSEFAYKVKNEGFANSRIEELSQFMTDDLGPRLAASQLKLRAEKMVVAKLVELGLSNPRVEFAYDFPKGGWDNQMNYVAMTEPYYCSFAANPKAWSGSTNGLVSGECVLLNVQAKADLDKYKGQLTGKIVLMPATQTYEMKFTPLATRLTDEELEELALDPRPTTRRYRPMGNWQAARELQQAISTFLKEENVLAIVSGGGTFNVPSSRGVQYKVGDPEPTPEIVLPIEDHGRMARMLAKGEKVLMGLRPFSIYSLPIQSTSVRISLKYFSKRLFYEGAKLYFFVTTYTFLKKKNEKKSILPLPLHEKTLLIHIHPVYFLSQMSSAGT